MYVWLPGSNVAYQGIIERVLEKEIIVVFAERFHRTFPPGELLPEDDLIAVRNQIYSHVHVRKNVNEISSSSCRDSTSRARVARLVFVGIGTVLTPC